MVSLQTTLARAEARAAEQAWRFHLANCPPCDRWMHRRQSGWRGCDEGVRLRTRSQAAERQLRAECEADLLPAPGQEELF